MTRPLSPRFVETERAQGYRFIAPVIEEPAPPNPEWIEHASIVEEHPAALERANSYSRHLRLRCSPVRPFGSGAGRSGSAPSTAQESSAPISLGGPAFQQRRRRESRILASGIPDGIITRLSNVRQFRVRPTSAVARYHGKEIDAQESAAGSDHSMCSSGTIRAAADRVRVSVQLVRTTMDRRSGAISTMSPAAICSASKMPSRRRSPAPCASRCRMPSASGSTDATHATAQRTNATLWGGRGYARSPSKARSEAIAEFQAARDLDPKYALAYAGLATAAAQLRVRFASEKSYEVWDARARQEARRALQLDPDLAEAHVALAAVYRFQEYDWDTVIRESRRALELNPSLDTPHLYLAVAYFHIGLLDEADPEVKAARELNPENRVEPLEILGAVNLFAGQTADAVSHLSQVQNLSDSRIVRYLLGWSLYYEGERQRAEALLESMIDDEGPLPGNARATLAAIRAARGTSSEARALAERVASEPELIHHGAYGLGTAYAQLRDPTTALRWLSQAARTGFPCYPWYERDPLLDPIRDDSRFANFMSDLRRSWEDARAKYAGGSGQRSPTTNR